MVSNEEFGSLIAEYEGFRDAILDEMAKLREEIENLKEDIKDIKNSIDEKS
jgi:archaellum component FlaC